MNIPDIRHPLYSGKMSEWEKWRLVYSGGDEFVQQYLSRFSDRESTTDFQNRREMAPTPNFAKAAVNDVRNAIYQRLADVSRRKGTESYQSAIKGDRLGVDRKGSSMNAFIGRDILGELLVMAKVGVFIDMPRIYGGTQKDALGKHPYLYRYLCEDILSWRERTDVPDEYDSLLLRDHYEITYDTQTEYGLPADTKIRYRLLERVDGKVRVKFFEEHIPINEVGTQVGEKQTLQVDLEGNPSDIEYWLNVNSIPFVVFELSDSLIADVANHQIALLNLESSDINYALKSNYPFYTEQADERQSNHLMNQGTPDGDGEAADAEKTSREVSVGATHGRQYSPGMDRPGFIHPSPEPLKASMEKQDRLKNDIRTLINLSLSNMRTTQASAESKSFDERGLEAGLSNIGLELEHGERKIARIWHNYEGKKSTDFSIKYPEKWSLKSDEERRNDAKDMRDLRDTIPSEGFQKEVSKEITRILLGSKITDEDLEKILNEIDDAESFSADPETIFRGVELGIIDLKLAARVLGVPEKSVELAAEDHANRLKRISESQASAQNQNPGARGITDLDPNPGQSGREEKAASRDTTQSGDLDSKIRGDAAPEASL